MIGFPDAAWSSLSHRGGCCANDRRCQRHTQTILSCPDAMNSYVYCPSFFSGMFKYSTGSYAVYWLRTRIAHLTQYWALRGGRPACSKCLQGYSSNTYVVRSTIAHWVGTCRLSAIFGIGSRSLESIYYYPLRWAPALGSHKIEYASLMLGMRDH